MDHKSLATTVYLLHKCIYGLIPRPCSGRENWYGIDYSRMCELRSNFFIPSIIILLFIPLVQSKMLSQGFDEASVARILLSSYPLGIHATKIQCWERSGRKRSKLLEQAVQSCCNHWFDTSRHRQQITQARDTGQHRLISWLLPIAIGRILAQYEAKSWGGA